jgi:hypothetical protein
MARGSWDWAKNQIIVDKLGRIMDGHHRVLAAYRAGVGIPESAIIQLDQLTVRPEYQWSAILQAMGK